MNIRTIYFQVITSYSRSWTQTYTNSVGDIEVSLT